MLSGIYHNVENAELSVPKITMCPAQFISIHIFMLKWILWVIWYSNVQHLITHSGIQIKGQQVQQTNRK